MLPAKVMHWGGWAMTTLVVFGMGMSTVMKFLKPKMVVDEMVGKLVWPESALFGLGLLELTCLLVYMLPRTAVLGAILLTAYLGGAVSAHVRVGDGFIPCVVLGVLVWGGLWGRDARVRALIPLC